MGTEDKWDAAFRVAFENASVLELIERESGTISRILLSDATADPSPIVRVPPASDKAAGDRRYSLIGEIARGGVGVIFKGHDRDLGRDVALKILRDEYAERDDIVERFVEEAQVTGQLQHPGVVPIYGLGVQGDGRPYFAMKLVKGATLSALLQERDMPAERLAYFIALFERICQTVGYAHSRGVVHRDLKPANIMVGAFGEVQVMDWGFAKVLGRSEPMRERGDDATVIATVRSGEDGSQSIVGSVMGTPAYMPPEQALGQVDDLDERADVFSLGAILCEILTGAPPYVGEPRDLLPMAARGDTSDACDRLRDCGAAEPVVSLATACLATASADRPRNANRLARRIAVQLGREEERARQAELAAAQARATEQEERARLAAKRLAAEEERVRAAEAKVTATRAAARAAASRRRAEAATKARRGTIAVAALLLVAVLLGGGAYSWNKRSVREQSRTRDGAARAAIRNATELEGSGNWNSALVAIRGAIDIAEDPSTVARASEVHRRIDSAKKAADAHAALLDRDRKLLRRIEENRTRAHDLNWSGSDALGEAFRAFGIDLASLDVEDAANRIRKLPSRETFAAELYFMAFARRTGVVQSPPAWQRLVEVAELVDPEGEWRWFRDQLQKRDVERLIEFASNLNVSTTPERTILALADLLRDTNRRTDSIKLLEEALATYPNSYWILWLLSSVYMESVDENQEHLRRRAQVTAAACALRPKSAYVRAMLARVYATRGDFDLAMAACDDALRLQKQSIHALCAKGWILRVQGDLEGARRPLEQALRLDSKSYNAHHQLAWVHHDAGEFDKAISEMQTDGRLFKRWAWGHSSLGVFYSRNKQPKQAAAAYGRACELAPNQIRHWYGWCSALEAAKDYPGLDQATKQMVHRFPKEPWSYIHRGGARMHSGDLDGAFAAYGRAMELDETKALAQGSIGVAYRLKGDWKRALELGRKAARLSPGLWEFRQLAASLQYAGYAEQAIQASRAALQYAPGDPDTQVAVAGALAYAGRFAEAVELCEAVIADHPDNVSAFTTLAWIYVDTDDPEQAAGALEEALRIAGDDAGPRVASSVVDVRTAQGRFREALEAVRTLRQQSSSSLFEYGRSGPMKAIDIRWEKRLAASVPFEDRVDDIVSGKVRPTSQPQRIGFALLCDIGGHYATAARLFEAAHADSAGLPIDDWNIAAQAATSANQLQLARTWLSRLIDHAQSELDDLEQQRLRYALNAWRRAPRLAALRKDPAWSAFEELFSVIMREEE